MVESATLMRWCSPRAASRPGLGKSSSFGRTEYASSVRPRPPGDTSVTLVKFRYGVYRRVSMKETPAVEAPTTTILVLHVILGSVRRRLVRKRRLMPESGVGSKASDGSAPFSSWSPSSSRRDLFHCGASSSERGTARTRGRTATNSSATT
jgi:hypothetical protein